MVSRRLDDQRYEEIVAEAEGRLPWLCPVWTDHNAHDPGITLLELMAWYKEMQQYQMDQMTPAVQRKLLELAGLHLLPARPAALAVEVTPEAPAYPALERLTTPQEALFELAEPVPAVRPKLAAILVERDGQRLDVKGLVDDGTARCSSIRERFGPVENRRRESGICLRRSSPICLWIWKFSAGKSRTTETMPPVWNGCASTMRGCVLRLCRRGRRSL